MRSAALALTSAMIGCVLLAGCATTPTPGRPTAGTGVTGGPVTASPVTASPVTASSVATAAPHASYDSSADAVLIHLAAIDATIAGVRGRSEATLYGDGRVLRTTDDGSRVAARISADSVAHLADRAATLLDAPDPGSPVTDTGSTTITVTVDGRTATLTMGHIPGGVDLNLPPDVQHTRDTIDELGRALSGLDGLDLVQPPTTLPPQSPTTSPTPTS